LPTDAPLPAGTSSTNAIQEKDPNTVTTPATTSFSARSSGGRGAHTANAAAMPGRTRYAASVFTLNARPTSTALVISQRQRPVSAARSPAAAASVISKISSGSTPLSRDTATKEGNTASASALANAAAVPTRRTTTTHSTATA